MAAAEGRPYRIAETVTRAAEAHSYERTASDPASRPLRIFALDPGASRLDGSIATIAVPFEPIEVDARGFHGAMFEVDPHDHAADVTYETLDLDAGSVALQSGYDPSPSNPLVHQQMVYAVCSIVYASFRTALGRQPGWGFTADHTRLVLRPFGAREANAWYDPQEGALYFGYFTAPANAKGRTPPNGIVFTSLAHDIVTHEVTHALLDGLRRPFIEPTNPDVPAFHEAFADLIAIFHRFSYDELVRIAIGRARGRLEAADLLTSIARQFGQAVGQDHGLRSPIDPPGTAEPSRYDPKLEPHHLGTILVSAVFSAFATVFGRKTARYVRLATGGTGQLPAGEMPSGLCEMLAQEASDLARQFLNICIRAIDYCPPVDLTFGEFLRALITADVQLVHDDPWRYREALIDAFRDRGIFPEGLAFLSEDALVWNVPQRGLEPIEGLTFRELRFAGDPGQPASREELHRQACTLGDFLTEPNNAEHFGIALADDPRLGADVLEVPVIQSVRTARRVGPDGQVLFDLVAEVTQVRHVERDGRRFGFLGGATIIIDPRGRVRYLISKSVLNDRRLERQASFMTSEGGVALWEDADGSWSRKRDLFRMLHHSRVARAAAAGK